MSTTVSKLNETQHLMEKYKDESEKFSFQLKLQSEVIEK